MCDLSVKFDGMVENVIKLPVGLLEFRIKDSKGKMHVSYGHLNPHGIKAGDEVVFTWYLQKKANSR